MLILFFSCRHEPSPLFPLRAQLPIGLPLPPGSLRGAELQAGRIPLEAEPGGCKNHFSHPWSAPLHGTTALSLLETFRFAKWMA